MKNKKLNLLLSIFISATTAFSQPKIEWTKCYGGSQYDFAYSINSTNDGGFIVGGKSNSNDKNITGNHGSDDFVVLKLDSAGNIQWQKSLGGSKDDGARMVQQTKDNGYIVTGPTFSSDLNVKGSHGWIEYWVVKLDSIGNIQWQKCLGGTNDDDAGSITQTNDSGYVVVGYTKSNDGNITKKIKDVDIWAVKLNTKGKIVWEKCLGGNGWDFGESVAETNDGGCIISGNSTSNDSFVKGNHGNTDVLVIKLDSSGKTIWYKFYGGKYGDYTNFIQQTKDGGYVVAGSTESNNGDVSGNHDTIANGYSDGWVIKLDSIGNLQWQKCIGGKGSEDVQSIRQTLDGGYILVGITGSNDGDILGNHDSTSSDAYVVKLNNVGKIEWQKCLGGSKNEWGYSILQNKSGAYIMSGSTLSKDGDVSGNNGNVDILVVKIASDKGVKISGKVTTSVGADLTSSKIYLVTYNSKDTTNKSVDSTITDTNGNYSFKTLESMVHLVAFPDTSKYKNQMVTWYNGAYDFQQCDNVVLTKDTIINFSTFAGSNKGGQGFIGGKVYWCFGCKKAGSGKPASKIRIVLVDSKGNLSANTFTDANGGFSFKNLAIENYKVWVDYPSIDNKNAPVIKFTDNINQGKLVFTLYKDHLEMDTTITDIGSVNSQKKLFSIFPNPVQSTFTINHTSLQKEELNIYNILGEVVLKEQWLPNQSEKTIDVSALPKGVYIVKLGQEAQKVVVR